MQIMACTSKRVSEASDEIDGIEQISLFGVLLGHGNVFMPKTTNLNAESYCWNLFILVNSPSTQGIHVS